MNDYNFKLSQLPIGSIARLAALQSEYKVELIQINEYFSKDPNKFGRTPVSNLYKILSTADSDYRPVILDHIAMIARRESVEVTLMRIQSYLDMDTYRTESGRPVFYTESSEMKDGAIEEVMYDENVIDTSGAPPEATSAGISFVDEKDQFSMLDMGDYLDRPVEIYNTTIAASTYTYINFNPWNLFLSQPSVRAKLRNFTYMRGELHVRIAVSGTPFDSGRLLVSYQPAATGNLNLTNLAIGTALSSNMRKPQLAYLSQAPGSVLIDVKENRATDMVLPFILPKPVGRILSWQATAISAASAFPDFDLMGFLYIVTMNTLKSVSSTPTPISLQVYAWIDNVELGVATGTQMVITTESGKKKLDERKVGPIENIASRAFSFSKQLEAIPLLAPYATASAMLCSGIASVATLLGWSRPPVDAKAIFVKPLSISNTALTIGESSAMKLSLDPLQELNVSNVLCGSVTDDMALSTIYTRPSYINTFAWNDSDPVMGAPIFISGVSPCISAYGAVGPRVHTQPSPMAFAAAPFAFWHGDIVFRFDVVASAFHRGKLCVYYEPNISQASLITPAVSLNKQNMIIVDIQQTQTFEVCVEWASARPWLRCTVAASCYYIAVDPTVFLTGYQNMNGFIAVVPFTKLQSPDSSDIEVNVFCHAKRLALNGLCTTNLPTERKTPSLT